MTYLYRCKYKQKGEGQSQPKRICGARRQLKKPIEQYATRPKCRACGRDSLIKDGAQMRRNKILTCKCSGVPYPHNKGTVIGCEHYDKPITEEDYRDWMDSMSRNNVRGI